MPLVLPRVYAIVDTPALHARGRDPLRFAEALLEGGCRLLQLRHKGSFSRQTFTLAQTLGNLCRQAGALYLIDDRADIAALCQAGVHVGQQDLPCEAVRRIVGPDALVGFSTHNEAQLRAAAAEPASYLALGPIFSTSSKQNADPVVGLERLAELRALTTLPLVAIGGITRHQAHSVWRAGADSVAVIGDLMPAELTQSTVRERMQEWLSL